MTIEDGSTEQMNTNTTNWSTTKITNWLFGLIGCVGQRIGFRQVRVRPGAPAMKLVDC
jgi:hypothetical protein